MTVMEKRSGVRISTNGHSTNIVEAIARISKKGNSTDIENGAVRRSTVIEEVWHSIEKFPTMGTKFGKQNSMVFDMKQSWVI